MSTPGHIEFHNHKPLLLHELSETPFLQNNIILVVHFGVLVPIKLMVDMLKLAKAKSLKL